MSQIQPFFTTQSSGLLQETIIPEVRGGQFLKMVVVVGLGLVALRVFMRSIGGGGKW